MEVEPFLSYKSKDEVSGESLRAGFASNPKGEPNRGKRTAALARLGGDEEQRGELQSAATRSARKARPICEC